MTKRILAIFMLVVLLFSCCCCKSKEQKSLFAEGSIVITAENLPKIAVTEANVGIAANLVSAIIGCTKEETKAFLTVCKTPDECYSLLADGLCDISIAHQPSFEAEQNFTQKKVSVLSQTIAKDALVFMVSEQNSVDNLEISQIKEIYSTKISDWSAVGGTEGEIRAFMQNQGLASYSAFNTYINADTSSLIVPTKTVQNKNGQYITELEYDNGITAIGYGLYYDAITPSANKNGSFKLLSVTSVVPNGSTIQSGSYPLVIDIKVTINSKLDNSSTAKLFYDWILSEQGTGIIANSGVILK